MYSIAPLKIIATSLLCSVLVESINYVILYRQHAYKRAIREAEVLIRDMDKQKASLEVNKKAGKRLEHQFFVCSRNLHYLKMRGMLVLLAVAFTAFLILRGQYKGVSVAKLPFQPIYPLSIGVSRGLINPDARDCSIYFFAGLCGVALRNTVSSAFGFQPSKKLQDAMSPYASWQKAMKKYTDAYEAKNK